jgi:chromosome segregation ATPase
VYNSELSTKLELADKEVLSSRLQLVEYNERLLVLQESVHETQSLLEEKDKAVEVAQCKADRLSHQLEKVQKNMEDSYIKRKELDGKLTFSKEIIEDLKQQLKVKVQEIESAEKANESLSEMLSTAKRQVSISQEELNERDERLARYDSIVQDTRKQYEEQKLICVELSLQLKSLSMENVSLQSRVAEQLRSLDEVNGLKNELMAEIKEKESQLEALELNLKGTVSFKCLSHLWLCYAFFSHIEPFLPYVGHCLYR